MPLHCVVYTSVSRQEMSDKDLKELLKKSRAKNQNLNITGMLLYLDPFYIQVLEGEEATVDQLFNVIKEDPHHEKVSIIYKKPIEERSFSDWSMGFNKISNEELESMHGFCDFLENPSSESLNEAPHDIKNLLDMFRHETLF